MSGVYATIEKKPNGTYALNYVLVRRFNARLHQSLNYLLRAPERTRAAKCLNVLKDAIRDCVYIGEAEVCFSNDRGFPFAFGDTRREYLVWSLDGKSIFCVPDSLLLEEAGEEYEDSGTRTFKTRETAEDFVFHSLLCSRRSFALVGLGREYFHVVHWRGLQYPGLQLQDRTI